MDLELFIFAAGFSFIEGFREYAFYTINRNGGFPDIQIDKFRKTVNALLFSMVFFIPCVVLELPWMEIAFVMGCLYSIRWIVLDGVLNAMRGFHVFYVGTVAGTDVYVRKMSSMVGIPPELTMGIVKAFNLACFITAYFISFS